MLVFKQLFTFLKHAVPLAEASGCVFTNILRIMFCYITIVENCYSLNIVWKNYQGYLLRKKASGWVFTKSVKNDFSVTYQF